MLSNVYDSSRQGLSFTDALLRDVININDESIEQYVFTQPINYESIN